LREKFVEVWTHPFEGEDAFAALLEARGELNGCFPMATGKLPEVTDRRAGSLRQSGTLIVCVAV